jgi:2-keto-4-pentenoate hydratase
MTFDIESGALSLVRDHEARGRFRPLDGLPDLAAAYRVQHAYVRRIIGGDNVAGYKIGLTSLRMQTMCGIGHPIAGVVFGKRVKQSGATLSLTHYAHLGLEFEICARIGRDLPPRSSPYTRADIDGAIDAVCAAMELVDDRHADYTKLDVHTLVADNSWNEGVVLGSFVPVPTSLEKVEGVVYQDGVEIGRGVGADALGHPFEPVAWLANHLAAKGAGLKKADLVMTGSIVRTCFPETAFSYRFNVSRVGSVEVSGA